MKKICARFFIIILLVLLSVNLLGAKINSKPVDTATEVYLGGRPLGIEIGADGVIVTGISKVETANGAEFPMKDSGVRSGDILTKIAGKSVQKPEDISAIVKKLPDADVILTFLRDGKPYDIRTKFVVDKNGERRFGVNVRDKITGRYDGRQIRRARTSYRGFRNGNHIRAYERQYLRRVYRRREKVRPRQSGRTYRLVFKIEPHRQNQEEQRIRDFRRIYEKGK